jgi:hypothetical protein
LAGYSELDFQGGFPKSSDTNTYLNNKEAPALSKGALWTSELLERVIRTCEACSVGENTQKTIW